MVQLFKNIIKVISFIGIININNVGKVNLAKRIPKSSKRRIRYILVLILSACFSVCSGASMHMYITLVSTFGREKLVISKFKVE